MTVTRLRVRGSAYPLDVTETTKDIDGQKGTVDPMFYLHHAESGERFAIKKTDVLTMAEIER